MKLGTAQKQIFRIFVVLVFWSPANAQTRPIVIQGGTLLDGTGRPAITDSVVVIRDGRFQEVGKRGEINLPQGAETIDAKGKTYTNIVHKDEISGLIQTATNLVHGMLYLRPGLRLKDELNNTAETFIAVTDAEVYNANGQVLVRSKFLTINKAHIVWIRPDEEPDEPAARSGE